MSIRQMGKFSMLHLLALAHRPIIAQATNMLSFVAELRPATTMSTPLQRFLGSGDSLTRLKDHAQRLLRLQTLFESMVANPLLRTCSVANLKGDTLVLMARNGAAAVRIKQMAPRLIEQFAAGGVLIKAIQVKIAVDNPERERTPRAERVLSDAGRASLAALCDSLPADAPLRASLMTLIERSRTQH